MNTDDEKKNPDIPEPAGLDIEGVSFDLNGEVTGLSDEVLASVTGGMISESYNSVCPEVNYNCAC